MKVNNLEKEKLEFEKEKFNMEFKLREREIALKEKESERSKFTHSQVAILVAIFGIFGTAIGAYMQGHTDEKLERLKFESDVILKAATSDNNEKNKRNLRFLLDAGFINDQNGSIRKLVTEEDADFKIEYSRDKKFQFQNVSLRYIFDELEKRFPVYFTYRSSYAQFTISGYFNMDDDLTNILEKIEKHAPIKFLIIGSTITLRPSDEFLPNYVNN
jgi:hypothetical protein